MKPSTIQDSEGDFESRSPSLKRSPPLSGGRFTAATGGLVPPSVPRPETDAWPRAGRNRYESDKKARRISAMEMFCP